MNVENFWRQLKHDFLHHILRPRLDQLVYILIYTVPEYVLRAEVLKVTHRSRPRLTTNPCHDKTKAPMRPLQPQQRRITHS